MKISVLGPEAHSTTGVSCKTLSDFSTGLLVNAYLGPASHWEYIFSGARLSVQLTQKEEERAEQA